MNWLTRVPAWCWWALALLVVAGGQQIRVGASKLDAANARQELADFRLEVSERDLRATAKARTEEQRRQTVADEEGRRADERIMDLEGRAVTAESRAVGMRDEIDRLRNGRSATCSAITTQQRQAREPAIVVLGGLLEESDRMAGSLAEALERSRIKGLTCEAVVDGIRKP
ncbi:DUF2514 family protein [Pseudomonas alkylphenolica]|uniref:DUF2514 family protein n=1 Tax=Pseudomonas alkylphenolica TaxID=237609 RepID=A0A077FAV2_9PSED|nr:DUF2514 family protein [Pseudomonas alkylphenolica]AIL60949.1 hypothetical protein PSAKL28_17240 [Pseudomonas alkylphenolica]